MKKILVIDSSPRLKDSVSRQVTNEVVAQLKNKYPGAEVLRRDLSANPLPHITEENINAYYTPPEQRNAQALAAIKASDQAVDELLSTDILVIGAPMWNFNVPSVLKAWIDHIVRAGRTFAFGPEGLKSLVTGKKVYLVLSTGSVYSEGPMKAMDFQEPYLKAVLGFLGMTDVEVIKAEGTNDPTASGKALEKARVRVSQL